MMALTRPAGLRQFRVRLPREPAGPGLALVAALSTAWGCFRTPAGKAVYFTLAFPSDLPV